MPPAFALSQDQTLKFIPLETKNQHKKPGFVSNKTKTQAHIESAHLRQTQSTPLQSVSVQSQKKHIRNASDHDDPLCKLKPTPKPKPDHHHASIAKAKAPATEPAPPVTPQKPETPPTYPFPAYSIVKQQSQTLKRQPMKTAPSPVPHQPNAKAWSAFYRLPTPDVK